MKKVLFLAAVCCLLSISAFGQKAPDFSGTWTLDAAKSQLDERSRVESMTLTVAQTATELKITSATTRKALPTDAPSGTGMGRGAGMGRGFGGDGTVAYSLEGKETMVEVDGPNGKMPIKYKASLEGGKANLSSSRSVPAPTGEATITTKESWSLSADGKTLTAVREQTTPRGSTSSTMVFVKK